MNPRDQGAKGCSVRRVAVRRKKEVRSKGKKKGDGSGGANGEYPDLKEKGDLLSYEK